MKCSSIRKKPILALFSVTLLSLLLTSCADTKKAIYFIDQGNASVRSNNVVAPVIIQPNDLLSISVNSRDKEATELFNSFNISGASYSSSAGTNTQINGYQVDAEGNVKVPFLGNVKAAGLTENALSSLIANQLVEKKLLIDPIVNVRHLNFKVTVLGEVARPTVITVPNGKISMLEALGVAGDLTIYAKRDNVLLIREEKGEKVTRRINLNSTELLTSPYFYLQSNDVVYVEPNKAKVSSAGRGQQLLPAILSGLSFMAILVDRITR
ncbi:polysaccharide biosynthesis/export family protein [Flavisolibacter sp. BT320]|nr:polysaccharide biosynthesis/export family protein [Flavisolibacter longurius]